MKTIIITLSIVVALFAQNERVNDHFAFLQQIYFENTKGLYDNYLNAELQTFLQKYPEFDQADQVLWMLGDVQINLKRPYAAFIQYFKIPILYPKSKIAPEAISKLDDLFSRVKNAAFLEKKDTVLAYLNQTHYFDSFDEAAVDMYNFLFSLDLSKLNTPLLYDLNQFERECRLSGKHEDILLFLKGQLNESLNHYPAAEANFRQLLALHKASLLAPDALFNTGWLDYRHLNKIEEAKNAFVRIINSYPNNENAPKAQFFLAELYVRSMDSLNAGIDNYRLFVDAFPDHPLFRKAFKRLTLLLFKTKRYEEAVTLIGTHLNKHAQDTTFYALVDSMALIFFKKFKKYEYAARCYVLLASANPESAKSPFYLYQAARIYMKFLKDIGRAKDVCQRLQEHYSQSPYATKCRLLIKQRIKK